MRKTELRLSHIHWRVNGIKKAVKDIEKLGFKVEWGRNPRYSPNAFIWFNDDVFIEIFTTLRPALLITPIMGMVYGKAMKERWLLWNKRKEGLLDFAVEPKGQVEGRIENLPNIRKTIRNARIEISKVMNGTRKNTRGEKVGFGFCGPMPIELPFLVSAFTIPQIPAHIKHPNGIKKIKYIKVECLESSIDKMRFMTGADERIILIPGKQNRILTIAFEGADKKLENELLHGMNIDY